MPFALFSGNHLMLPAHEVSVPDAAVATRPIDPQAPARTLAEVVDEHGGRPEVGNDVVDDKEDNVLSSRSVEQMDSEKRPLLQVEGPAS